MQVGCGVYVHRVGGRPYLYFWHYETRGGSRRQIKEYVGPQGTARAREEAVRRCEAYYAKVGQELESARTAILAELVA